MRVCGIRFRLSGKNFTFGSFAVTIGEERRSRRQKKHLKQFFYIQTSNIDMWNNDGQNYWGTKTEEKKQNQIIDKADMIGKLIE